MEWGDVGSVFNDPELTWLMEQAAGISTSNRRHAFSGRARCGR
jgi:hypothetical protein